MARFRLKRKEELFAFLNERRSEQPTESWRSFWENVWAQRPGVQNTVHENKRLEGVVFEEWKTWYHEHHGLTAPRRGYDSPWYQQLLRDWHSHAQELDDYKWCIAKSKYPLNTDLRVPRVEADESCDNRPAPSDRVNDEALERCGDHDSDVNRNEHVGNERVKESTSATSPMDGSDDGRPENDEDRDSDSEGEALLADGRLAAAKRKRRLSSSASYCPPSTASGSGRETEDTCTRIDARELPKRQRVGSASAQPVANVGGSDHRHDRACDTEAENGQESNAAVENAEPAGAENPEQEMTSSPPINCPFSSSGEYEADADATTHDPDNEARSSSLCLSDIELRGNRTAIAEAASDTSSSLIFDRDAVAEPPSDTSSGLIFNRDAPDEGSIAGADGNDYHTIEWSPLSNVDRDNTGAVDGDIVEDAPQSMNESRRSSHTEQHQPHARDNPFSDDEEAERHVDRLVNRTSSTEAEQQIVDAYGPISPTVPSDSDVQIIRAQPVPNGSGTNRLPSLPPDAFSFRPRLEPLTVPKIDGSPSISYTLPSSPSFDAKMPPSKGKERETAGPSGTSADGIISNPSDLNGITSVLTLTFVQAAEAALAAEGSATKCNELVRDFALILRSLPFGEAVVPVNGATTHAKS